MIAVTTSLKGTKKYTEKAKEIAKLLNLVYFPRLELSTNKFCLKHNLDAFLQITGDGPVLISKSGETHKFHIGMAQLRIKNIDKGNQDHLITAIGNDCKSFLDCTLGLGIDSIVAAYGLPNLEKIVGIEGCVPLAYITNNGYRNFVHENQKLTARIRKINVLSMNYNDYLLNIPNKSYDVVYFDPMFVHGIKESSQFLGLRNIVLNDHLNEFSFQLACNIARKRVIIKERSFSTIFKKLGINQEVGGKYSRIKYGIYNV